jgi:hypothetical protein
VVKIILENYSSVITLKVMTPFPAGEGNNKVKIILRIAYGIDLSTTVEMTLWWNYYRNGAMIVQLFLSTCNWQQTNSTKLLSHC